jgi:hypothetical protein
MKAKSLSCSIGSGLAVAVALGILAALPAQAGSGLIKITHSDTPYRGATQRAVATVAQAQPTTGEIQVAVMAKAPVAPTGRRGIFIRR